MPKKGKDGKYHSKVTPAPGVKPVYFEASTLREFREKREAIIRDYVTGASVRDAAFVDMAREWFEVVKLPRIRTASTRLNYVCIMRRIYAGFAPNLLCRAVRYPQLQKFLDGLTGECASTIMKTQYVLRSVCGYAVSEGAMTYNHALSLQRPVAKKTEKRTALTGDQAAALRAAAQDDPYGVVVLLAYYTGMRLGEALGLQWKDVDLSGHQIHIRRARIGHARIGESIGTTKTTGSERTVPIPPNLYAVLEPRLGLPNAFVAPASSLGSPLTQHTFRERFGDILVRAGLASRTSPRKYRPDVTMHWLRHNYATACYRAGVPLSIAMQWLGHADMKNTVSVYADIKSALRKDGFSENQDDHLRDVLVLVGKKLDVWSQAW